MNNQPTQIDPVYRPLDNDTTVRLSTHDEVFIAVAYLKHCDTHHWADFEVCRNPLCRAAMALESLGFGVPSLSANSFADPNYA